MEDQTPNQEVKRHEEGILGKQEKKNDLTLLE